mgnify:FL=1
MLVKEAPKAVVSNNNFLPTNIIDKTSSPPQQKQTKRNISHACINCQKKKCKCIPIENLELPDKLLCETCKQSKKLYCEFRDQKKRGPSSIDTGEIDKSVRNFKNESVIRKDDINIIKGVLNKHKNNKTMTKGKINKETIHLPLPPTSNLFPASRNITPSTYQAAQMTYFQNFNSAGLQTPNKFNNPLLSSIPNITKPPTHKHPDTEWIHESRNVSTFLLNPSVESDSLETQDTKHIQREKSTEKLFEFLLYGYNNNPQKNNPHYEVKRKISDLLNSLKKKTVDDIYDDVVTLENLLSEYLTK